MVSCTLSLPYDSLDAARLAARRNSAHAGTRYVLTIPYERDTFRVADGRPQGAHQVLAVFREGEEVRP